ncbi:MAG: lamin tail domain-containing protein, partial [Phycisphaerae bacterium]|nr:lamin tail domain-containing protein [Phycisphaerae bacterium]
MAMSRNCGFVLVAAAVSAVSGAAWADPSPGLKIARVYPGGGATTGSPAFKRDFVELKNTSNATINTGGWSVQYQSSTGTTWLKVDLIAVDVDPGEHFLLLLSNNNASTLGPLINDFDQSATTIALANSAGKIALVQGTTALPTGNPCASSGNGIVDFLAYGTSTNACFETAAAAYPAPDTVSMLQRNLNGCSDTDNNSNDFTVVPATLPRWSGSPAEACGGPSCDAGITLSSSLTACETVAGTPVTYTVVATNTGPDTAAGTVCTVTLSPRHSFVGVSATDGSAGEAGGVITWNLGSFVNGASATLTINTIAAGAGNLDLSASIATTTPDTGAANNQRSTTNVVRMVRTPVLASVIAATATTAPASKREILLPNGSTRNFEFSTGSTFDAFHRPFASADGTKFVMRVNTDEPDGTLDEAVVVGTITGGGVTLSAVAQQGFSVVDPDIFNDTLGATIDPTMSVNNAGQVAFSGTTNRVANSNDVVVRYTPGSPGTFKVIAREGLGVPESFGLDLDTTWGAALTARGMLDDGSVDFLGQLAGSSITTSTDRVIARSDGTASSIRLRKGVTIPAAIPGSETGPFSFFDDDDELGYWVSGDGTTYLVSGTLATPSGTSNDKVAVQDGEVVSQEGQVLPGFLPATISGSSIASLYQSAAGDGWGILPTNTTVDMVVIAEGIIRTGDPITVGDTEVWSDTAMNPTFAATFFAAASRGDDDWVVAGVTSQPDTWSNGVVVYKGQTVLLREGDPVDLDGNGLADDNCVINTFRNSRMFIGADRRLYAVVSLRNPSICSGVTVLGQALIAVPLPPEAPTGCSPADVATEGSAQPFVDGPDGFITGT